MVTGACCAVRCGADPHLYRDMSAGCSRGIMFDEPQLGVAVRCMNGGGTVGMRRRGTQCACRCASRACRASYALYDVVTRLDGSRMAAQYHPLKHRNIAQPMLTISNQ